MTYQIGTGWNNAAGLADVAPQPNSQGVSSGRRLMTGEGLIVEDGYYSTEWNYGYLTKTQLNTLFTAMGVAIGTPSAKVTVRTTINKTRGFGTFNAIIVAPEIPSDAEFTMTRWLNIKFRIIRMEEY